MNRTMSEKPSKDEALEALDFIVNVLKEHEKDLDKLVNELGTVADQLGDTGELNGKVEKIEEKITGLQTEVTSLIKRLSNQPNQPQQQPQQPLAQATKPAENNTDAPCLPVTSNMPMQMQCKQWEDFQTLAAQAQTISFTLKENEHTFEAGALKPNQIITYTGTLPQTQTLLKAWLSKELNIQEKKILEGILTLK